ncbi:MAG: mercury methylation corrinoid protein HgcA [Dissulfurispiraceae bacterium]
MGSVPLVSTDITRTDKWEHLKCRTSSFRNNYTVIPGLYAVGSPSADSDVIVTANYKYSFDIVRHALKGLNIWILVLDTNGINVWCAAGKGTFGTEELVKRINIARLTELVNHKRVIVPQLGAVGVISYKVSKATGFKVHFGPVRAEDIRSFIAKGYNAGPEMRTIHFSIMDRLVLTPMEINPAIKKFPLFALIVLLIFGLQPQGIFFKNALLGGLPFLVLGLAAILSGTVLTPVLLPFIPFRSFAIKGWIVGMATILVVTGTTTILDDVDALLPAVTYIFFPMLSSFWALQFTGSTTYTSMAGVKKEMKIAIPVYIGSLAVTGILAMLYKMRQWGVL